MRLVTTVCAAAAVALPPQAAAGPWVAPEGGLDILSASYGDRDGVAVFTGESFSETPLRRRWSAVVQASSESALDLAEGWRGEGSVGLKHLVRERPGHATAVQLGVLWRSDPQVGCGEGGGELRALAGWSGPAGEGSWFASTEAGGRWQAGGCSGARADATLGARSGNGRWLGLAQVFHDEPGGGERTTKAQIALVRFDRRGRGLQLGYRARIDGGGREAAVVVSIWRERPRRAQR